MKNFKTNPVNWFEIYVQDMNRAQKFYENVLQIQMQQMTDPTSESMNMVGFPMTGREEEMLPGSSGSLVKMEGVPSGGNSTIIYFTCEDCANEESRVEAAGGKIFKPKMSIGEYGFMSLIIDTEGNMIGLHSLK